MAKNKQKIKSDLKRVRSNYLKNSKLSGDDLTTLANWRSNHSKIIDYTGSLIIEKLEKHHLTKEVSISDRLKRLPTIINKIQRQPKMRLHKMQDIAGIRIVCNDLDTVYKVKEALLQEAKNTKNKINKYTDYIQDCRNTGYRGMHMIYRYNNPDDELHDYATELQIRTQRQHTWAMAVELASFILQEDLKSGKGENDWLEFFKNVSDLFYSKDTNSKIDKETLARAEKLYKRLNVGLLLKNISNTIIRISRQIINNNNTHSVLIHMKIENKRSQTSLEGYDISKYLQAINKYKKIETNIIDNKTENSEHVVLVRIGVPIFKDEDLQDYIKSSFPSFFTDAEVFLKELNSIFPIKSTYHIS